MPAIDQIWLFLTGAVMAGLIVGAILTRTLSDRHAHYNDVRWRRRFNESQAEHELRIATLTKTLDHAREKQATLRQALDESDETIRLYSNEGASPFEADIAERNTTIADLKKTVSHSRAMVADAQDHELALQGKFERIQTELAQRVSEIDDLKNQVAEHSDQGTDNHDHENKLIKLQTELNSTQENLLEREQQLTELGGQLKDYEAKLSVGASEAKDQDRRIAVLVEQLKDLRELLPRLNQSIGEHETVMAGVVAELSAQRQKTLALQQKSKQDEITVPTTEETPEFTAKVVSIHKHLISDDLLQPHSIESADDSEKRVRRLESELQEWKNKYEAANGNSQSPTPELHGVRNSKDDLKQINGIGPVLESALNELGFYQFEQIAGMEQGDIEKMGRYDRTLPGRIRRYNWVEQARELHQSAQANGHSDA